MLSYVFDLQVIRTLDLNYGSGEYKMVFVVRNDLKMGKGKVAAQASHIFWLLNFPSISHLHSLDKVFYLSL